MGEVHPQAEIHRVQDVDRVIEFEGTLITNITTEVPESPRWLELELYRLTDGTDRYVLHVVGRSVVYHVHDGACNTGVAVDPQDLPEDSEPCFKCKPFAGDGTVDLESDRHTVHVCDTASDVVDKLRLPRGGASGSFSAPSRRLLDHAAMSDDGIRAAISPVQRL